MKSAVCARAPLFSVLLAAVQDVSAKRNGNVRSVYGLCCVCLLCGLVYQCSLFLGLGSTFDAILSSQHLRLGEIRAKAGAGGEVRLQGSGS